MKWPRFDFSDYSAKEQEKDAMKSRFRQVYLMKVDGQWGHYTIIDGKEDLDFHDGDLTETYFELKAKLPEHQVRVIQNEGLENYLRDKRPEIMKKRAYNNVRQLKINFNQGGRE